MARIYNPTNREITLEMQHPSQPKWGVKLGPGGAADFLSKDWVDRARQDQIELVEGEWWTGFPKNTPSLLPITMKLNRSALYEALEIAGGVVTWKKTTWDGRMAQYLSITEIPT